MNQSDFQSRRRVILAGACSGFLLPALGALAQVLQPRAPDLAPTPACRDGGPPTPAEIEGPYFTPRSPLRGDLREAGLPGRPVELSGVVMTRSCRPIANALVDLWHADDRGQYDNFGYRLRGHVFTDAQGRYAFRTIVPGLYPGRTRHYHVKVQAPNSPVLTTQLYFPNETLNRRDEFFHDELVMGVAAADDALRARFDVVLALT
jgi:protocatechuate 3,4-dioxygenase beta subunit